MKTILSPKNAGKTIELGDGRVQFDDEGRALGIVSYRKDGGSLDGLDPLNDSQFNAAAKNPVAFTIEHAFAAPQPFDKVLRPDAPDEPEVVEEKTALTKRRRTR